MKHLLAVLALAVPSAAQFTATPAAFQVWPGDAIWTIFNQPPATSTRYETIFDNFPAGVQFSQLAFRPFQNQPAVTVDLQIDISVGVAPSTAPTWTHNASKTTVFPRQVINLPGLCTTTCGNPPLEPSTPSPWTWNIPFATPMPVTPAGGSTYVDVTIWSVTLTGIGTNVAWVVEGFGHTHNRPLAPFITNEGRYLKWGAMACGPAGGGGKVSWWHDLATTDAIMVYGAPPPTTAGIFDFVNIGVPVTTLPFVPLGPLGILCQPQIDTSVATYLVPVPIGGGSWKEVARVPWLPAYNFTAFWEQSLRWDAVSGTFLWLSTPGHFTVHYSTGFATPMPADSRIGGVPSGTGDTKGPVMGWR